jgi:hypothetical protein
MTHAVAVRCCTELGEKPRAPPHPPFSRSVPTPTPTPTLTRLSQFH